MTTYAGLFTGMLDAIKTGLVAVMDGGDRRYPNIFFGPIAEGEFFALNRPAVSILFDGAKAQTGDGRIWDMPVSVIYMMYDANFTDDYDVIAKSEVLMDDLNDILEARGEGGFKMHGDPTGAKPFRFDHEDSYVFMFQIGLDIEVKEV